MLKLFVCFFLAFLLSQRWCCSSIDSDLYFPNFPDGQASTLIVALDGCSFNTPGVWVTFLKDFPDKSILHLNVTSWSNGELTAMIRYVFELDEMYRGDVVQLPSCVRIVGEKRPVCNSHSTKGEIGWFTDLMVYEVAMAADARDLESTPKYTVVNGDAPWAYSPQIIDGVVFKKQIGAVFDRISRGSRSLPQVAEAGMVLPSDERLLSHIEEVDLWAPVACEMPLETLIPFVPQPVSTTSSTRTYVARPRKPDVYTRVIGHCLEGEPGSVSMAFTKSFAPDVEWTIGIEYIGEWTFVFNDDTATPYHSIIFPESPDITVISSPGVPFVLPRSNFCLIVGQREKLLKGVDSFSIGVNQNSSYNTDFKVRVDDPNIEVGKVYYTNGGYAWYPENWIRYRCVPEHPPEEKILSQNTKEEKEIEEE